MPRRFSFDPTAKFEYEVSFSRNLVNERVSIAKGNCRKVSDISLRFKTYSISEGGNPRPFEVPVEMEPITVTFEGLLFPLKDMADWLQDYINRFEEYNATGSLHRSNWLGRAFNQTIDCSIKRMVPRKQLRTGNDYVPIQDISLYDGVLKEAVLVDEISATNDLAVERMQIVFLRAEMNTHDTFVI